MTLAFDKKDVVPRSLSRGPRVDFGEVDVMVLEYLEAVTEGTRLAVIDCEADKRLVVRGGAIARSGEDDEASGIVYRYDIVWRNSGQGEIKWDLRCKRIEHFSNRLTL